MEYKFTDENFDAEVLQSDLPVFVDFYADWCVPCKMMAPIVKELAEKYDGKVKTGKLDTQENPAVTEKYGVMSIPTFMIFRKGEVIFTVSGAVPRQELEDALDHI